MTLDAAAVLLALAVAGIVLAFRYLRKKPKLRIICLVLLSLIVLVLAGYIGLTLILVDAARNQPPAWQGETIIIEKQRAKVSFRIPSLFAYVLHTRIRQLTVISLNYFLIAVKPKAFGFFASTRGFEPPKCRSALRARIALTAVADAGIGNRADLTGERRFARNKKAACT